MKLTQKKRNRGRKRKKNDIKNNEIHDKNSDDNLQRKIQVHYLSFIVSFLNVVLKELGYDYEFLNLENKFKIKVSNNYVKELNKKNLGEIICNKISKKYKNYNENHNKKIYEKLKDDKVLKNIFSENYLKFVENKYYKNKRNKNMKEYGLNKEITLSSEKLKLIDDSLNNNNFDIDNKKRLNEFIINNFVPKKDFT